MDEFAHQNYLKRDLFVDEYNDKRRAGGDLFEILLTDNKVLCKVIYKKNRREIVYRIDQTMTPISATRRLYSPKRYLA